MNRRRSLPAALVLALAIGRGGAAVAVEPKAEVEGAQVVAAGQAIVLDASKSASDRPLKWQVRPRIPFLKLTDDESGKRGAILFAPAPPPGVYQFVLVAIGQPDPAKPDLDVDVATIQVTVGGTPPPGPTPTPAPPVVGSGPPAHLILVYDPAEPDSTAALRTDPSLGSTLRSQGVRSLVLTRDDPRIASLNLAPYILKAGGLPAVIVQADDGRVLAAARSPSTREELLGLVVRLRTGGPR